MTFLEFCNYTHDEQSKIIRKWVDNPEYLDSIVVAGHTKEMHFEQSSEDILKRTMSELKTCSSFPDVESANFAICDAIYYKAPEIASWIADPARKHERTFVLSVDLGEQVGKGVSINLKEMATNAVCVVLERNFAATNLDGRFFFVVKTAYPDLKHESAKETGRDFTKEAQEIYKKESEPLFKGFWALKTEGYFPATSIGVNGKCIYVPFNVNEHQYNIMLNNESRLHRYPHISQINTDAFGRRSYIKIEKIAEDVISPEERQTAYDIASSIQDRFYEATKEGNTDINFSNITNTSKFSRNNDEIFY